MSITDSPRPSITSERVATNNQATPTLPSKFRVPPLPPRILRRLYLSPQHDGLLLSSNRSSTSSGRSKNDVLIGYGPKGQVKRWDEIDLHQQQQQRKQRPTSNNETVESLEIGGILGLTRLWETAYLIIFLSPPRSSSATTSTGTGTTSTNTSTSGIIKIFPPEIKHEFPNLPLQTPSRVEESDPLIRGLRAIAEREGLLSPDGRLNAYSPRSAATVKHGNADEDEGVEVGDESERDEGQGVVFELRNVYAVPLNKEGAEGIIKSIHAATNKNKPKPSSNTAPATPGAGLGSGPSGTTQHPDTSMSSSRASLDPETAETPAQVLARALNPARWNLGIPKKPEVQAVTTKTTKAAVTSSSKEVNEEVNQAAATSGSTRQSTDGSGDIGESMLHEPDQDNAATAIQKGDKATGEEHFDGQAGLPKPEEVMAQVPETRLKDESSGSTAGSSSTNAKRTSFMDGLKVDWNKMFGKTSKTSSDQGEVVSSSLREDGEGNDAEERDEEQRLNAQVPGVLGEEMEERETVNVHDGEVRREEAGEPVAPGLGASTDGQRKNLEIKIVREIVRTLGGGGFFYSFETDLSHNLQYKRKQLDTRHQSSGLLGSLLQKEEGSRDALPLASPAEPATPEGDLSESMLGATSVPPPSRGGEGLAAAAEIVDKKDPVTLAKERQERGETWVEPDVGLPLWRRVDQRFMWNAWMMRDFIDAGLHEYILPVIQGWVQSSRFYIPPVEATPSSSPANAKSPMNNQDKDLGPPSTPVDLVLISRRSRDRAGLRFQRRGIDEEGNVANFVETEMIIRVKVEGKWSIFSFVQIRGSIPLFWSQSSTLTDMKPAPKLDRPVAQTTGTTRLHFDHLTRKYGPQTIINLAETSGKEGSVTLGYRDVVKDLDDKDVRYVEFDFHHECKGMKYENISKLINQLGSTFSEQGYFWSCQGEVMREQTGAFRVNCIDCLDRTNVVESALARHILTSQLTQVGMTPDIMTSNIEFVYNDAWANNGDQISKLYAGTSALKGDFTRTGKRDLHGMINDGLNSVARMRRGAIEDFYLQAVISFMVGERNLTVFSEVLSNLASNDRTNLMRLSRIRAAAIETCTARVLEEGENRVCGWTVFSPEEANAKFTRKMEEKVLILTPQALYVVSFDYNLEKVVSSTRVPLRNITSMSKGAYILSALEESGRDPAENAGFVVHYRPAKTGTRITSYSMANALESNIRDTAQDPATPNGNQELFAFKVLPREFVSSHLSTGHSEEDEDDDRGKDETCRDVTERMVRRIRDECVKATASVGGYVGGHAREEGFVRDEDVVGLAEAQKATSLVARADYALKRFLWMP